MVSRASDGLLACHRGRRGDPEADAIMRGGVQAEDDLVVVHVGTAAGTAHSSLDEVVL